jgi:hypothetical protein
MDKLKLSELTRFFSSSYYQDRLERKFIVDQIEGKCYCLIRNRLEKE